MSKIPKFLLYQWNWIRDAAYSKLCEKSRRVGITYAESYSQTVSAAKGEYPKYWFSSADLSASEEFIDYVLFWSRFLDVVARDAGEVVINKDDDITAHRAVFSNGCEINALTSNPTRFRSKGGYLTGDEFAHHKAQEKLFTAMKPATMRRGKIRLISTHNGDDSYFNGLVNEILKGNDGSMSRWSHHKITLEDAIKDGLVDQIIGHKASEEEVAEYLEDCFAGMTQEAIDEEFHCIPRSSTNSHLLPYEIINPCERDNILDELLVNVTGDLYVGVDIARRRNFTVIWVDEKLGDVTYARKIIALQKMRFRDQKEILYGVLSHPKMRRCCIDATGIGANLAEDAAIDFGELKVEEVTMTNSVENELATDLYVTMDDRRTRIPRDKKIRDDFYSVKCVTTAAGHKRYEAPTAKDGSHADFFWGKALCNHAAKTYTGPLIITSGGAAQRQINKVLKGYLG